MCVYVQEDLELAGPIGQIFFRETWTFGGFRLICISNPTENDSLLEPHEALCKVYSSEILNKNNNNQ